MRQRESLSPEAGRELDALDRALAGERVDADLRELEQLAHDVRATAPQMSPGFAASLEHLPPAARAPAPQMSPGFAASLEHRVAEGFPASAEHPAPRSPRRWVLL